MKYCDDVGCPNFSPGDMNGDCKLGFKNNFRVPNSMADVMSHNWGYKMPRVYRVKLKQAKTKSPRALIE